MDEKNILPEKASSSRRAAKAPRPVRFLTAVTAIVVVIAITVLLILSSLPSNILEFDMTENDLYGVTAQTQRLLDSLEYDVDVVVVTDEASLEEHLTKFLSSYAALSPHIKVTYADPVTQPSVLDTYGVETNTVLVKCDATGRRATFNVSGFEGQDTAALLYSYSSYMMTGTLSLSSFDGEGQLASAVNSVVTENTNKIYYLAGHGETSMSTVISDLIAKANYTTGVLDLLTEGKIPEDCDLIICYAPTTDMSADELYILKDWMASGGRMILICDNPSLTNFCDLMLTYGIQLEQGYLADLNNYYENYLSQFGYYCFWPVFNTESDLYTSIQSNAMVISARPMTLVTPQRRGSGAEYFMSSSARGVNYVDEDNMEEGTYYVGVVATEGFESGPSSRLTVISCPYFIDDSLLSSFSNIANSTVFMNAVNASFDDVTVFTIPVRSLSPKTNSFVNTAVWSIFFVGIVPVVFIGGGLVFWSKRRKQ